MVVLRPLQFGYFNFTAAEVSYKPAENAASAVVSITQVPIINPNPTSLLVITGTLNQVLFVATFYFTFCWIVRFFLE